MALKLFCKSCKEFIRNVGPKEMRSVTGEEICESCAGQIQNMVVQVKKVAADGMAKIKKAEDYALANIEKELKKVAPQKDPDAK